MPFNPVIDRLGAESVPNTEAPLVTVWARAGTSEERLEMLFATAAAAAILGSKQSANTKTVLVDAMLVVSRPTMNV